MKCLHLYLIFAFFSLLLPLLTGAVLRAAESTQADDVRAALRAQAPPWYNREHDGWQVVAPKEPKPQTHHDGHWFTLPSTPFAVALWLLIGGLLAALIIVLVRQWRDSAPLPRAARTPTRTQGAARLAALPAFAGHGDLDHDQALSAALATGDWDAACAHLYAVLLTALDDAGCIRLDAATTNRGYLRAARADARSLPLADDLAQAAGWFEAVAFGHRHVDGADVRALAARRGAFTALADMHATASAGV